MADSVKRTSSRVSAKGQSSGLIRAALKIIIVLLVIVLLLQLVYHLIISPRIQLRNVQIDSAVDISLEELLRHGGINIGQMFHLIDEQLVASRLESLPDVRIASVQRSFPDGLRVSLEARVSLCIVMVEQDGVSFPALLDEEGVVFRIGSQIQDWSLPLVRGVEFDDFAPGAVPRREYRMMMDDIRRLSSQSPEVLRAFSEFRIEERYPGVFEWVLLPIHLPLRVRTSPGLDREQGLYILKIVELMRQQGVEAVDEIDFRTGDVIYSPRGG